MKRWRAAWALALAVLSGCGPRKPEELRREAIQRTMRGIERECERNAGGDWNRWFLQLAPFRAALRKAVSEPKPYNPSAEGTMEARCALLEAPGDPPLFETCPTLYLAYLFRPMSLDRYIQSRRVLPAIKAASAWLRKRGIDVIVVPVPKMTEVYADRVVPGTPADGIVAPQARRLLLELLKADVEVIDLLPKFLEARRSSAEPLYRPVDSHWGPRGIAIAAEEIGQRLSRYDFVRKAQAEPAGYTVVRSTTYEPGSGYPALNPEQKQRVEKHLTAPQVFIDETPKKLFAADSAVTFIGDSYNYGLMPQVAWKINGPVRQMIGGGHTTEAIGDFVRDPTLLDKCRVVVWVNQFFSFSEAEWNLPPLP